MAALGVAGLLIAGLAPLPAPISGARDPEIGPHPDTAGVRNTDSLVDLITGAAPFRASRSRPEPGYAADPPAPPVVRILPQLNLRGLLLVRGDPVAVVEGIPGVPGQAVVRVGDRPGDGSLLVQAISGTGVTVVGLDTLWRLTLKGVDP